MELRCITLQKELVTPQKKVKAANSLQEVVEINGFPYVLAARVIELEGFLENAENQYQVASHSTKEKSHQVEEHQKSILYETQTHNKDLKDPQDEVVGLKLGLHDSLQWTMQDALGVCERFMKHAKRFCPDAMITGEELDSFKPTTGVFHGGGPGTSASDDLD